jgi:hypothetical protein
MKPATHGCEKAWMIALCFVAPWVACLIDGGTTQDVVLTLVLWMLGLWLLCIPQILAVICICRPNNKRERHLPMLPTYRGDAIYPSPVVAQQVLDAIPPPSSTSASSSQSTTVDPGAAAETELAKLTPVETNSPEVEAAALENRRKSSVPVILPSNSRRPTVAEDQASEPPQPARRATDIEEQVVDPAVDELEGGPRSRQPSAVAP